MCIRDSYTILRERELGIREDVAPVEGAPAAATKKKKAEEAK